MKRAYLQNNNRSNIDKFNNKYSIVYASTLPKEMLYNNDTMAHQLRVNLRRLTSADVLIVSQDCFNNTDRLTEIFIAQQIELEILTEDNEPFTWTLTLKSKLNKNG